HRASRPRYESEKISSESGADRDFKPDIEVRDGETIEGAGWALQAVATPGHTANHLAFAWRQPKYLFVGDHVMGWSTSIVAPPDVRCWRIWRIWSDVAWWRPMAIQ